MTRRAQTNTGKSMPNRYDLQRKTILLTGANGNIGQSLAIECLKNGATLYLADVHDRIDDGFKKKLQRRRLTKYSYHTVDISSKKSILLAKKSIGTPIDIVINNAGIGVYTPFEDRTEEEISRVMDVNLKGTILVSQIFSTDMIRRRRGKIINVGSIYGVTTPDKRIYGASGRNSSEIYGATKAGVIHVTRYLAAYLAEYSITVNAVSPGGVFHNQHPDFVKKYTHKTPLQRMATVEDLHGILLFLCSSESEYITGQNIVVDGGFTVW